MRGRNPQPLCLSADEEATLQRIAESQTRPGYQVRRARIVLGVATGQRVQTLAEQMQCILDRVMDFDFLLPKI
jgi:hypothetical protein